MSGTNSWMSEPVPPRADGVEGDFFDSAARSEADSTGGIAAGSAALTQLARTWRGDPELGRLAERILHARDHDALATAAAEAIVAKRLRDQGCTLRVEIPTPAGRSCDFEVACGETTFFLHVKRLRPSWQSTPLLIPEVVRSLERIERPWIVALRWREGLRLSEMRRLLAETATFINDAHLGDEMTVRDDAGEEIGAARILAPGPTPRVALVIGLPREFGDALHRVQRLLRKAFGQFMPGRVNVVAIVGESDERHSVETALLGSPAERWDRLPPRGERIAHGRADDGFWHGGRYAESAAVAWCRANLSGEVTESALWIREGAEVSGSMRTFLERLFQASASSA